jgi:hypothetical protein
LVVLLLAGWVDGDGLFSFGTNPKIRQLTSVVR